MVGSDSLTWNEHRAAVLTVEGVSSAGIAAELGIGVAAANRLLAAVHRKLGTGREGLSAALGLPRETPGPPADRD